MASETHVHLKFSGAYVDEDRFLWIEFLSLFQHRTRKLTSAFLSAMAMGKWNLHEEVDSLTGEQISSDFLVTVVEFDEFTVYQR